MITPSRPLVRYHGGKWKLAPWIISHFPEHRIYTEAFGGGASVLLRKKPVYNEVYNDLDDDIVNLMEIVRDHGEELIRLIELTPFSRKEFVQAYEPCDDPMERARRALIRSYQGVGSAAISAKKTMSGFRSKGGYNGTYGAPPTGFRAAVKSRGTAPAKDWRAYPEVLPAIIERLRGVVIENRDAKELLLQHDTDWTLHYVDPPYPLDTRYARAKDNCYRFEMTDDEHIELLHFLKELKGFVILSGYMNEMYQAELNDWDMVTKEACADGGKKRVECLWLNPKAAAVQRQQKLFPL